MTASVPSIPLRRPLTAPTATMCHARWIAKKVVKAQMKAAGLKVNHVEARIITAQANEYLDAHRDDLLAEAAMAIDSVPGLRELAEAEAKRRRRTVR
jgi:hypothetical protein